MPDQHTMDFSAGEGELRHRHYCRTCHPVSVEAGNISEECTKYEALGGGDLTPEQLEGMELWDRDVMLDIRHRVVGAMLARRAVAEVRRHRATMKRLEKWADQLESARIDRAGSVGPFIAAELRNRMKGGGNG
jgi:hypothetical protein